MPLSLTDAHKVIEKANAKARQIGIKVTVAIVDEGGHLIALSRMDGAIPLSPQLAEAKAVGAAMFGRDGEALAKMAQDRPGFFSAADRLVRVPLGYLAFGIRAHHFRGKDDRRHRRQRGSP